MESKKKIVAWSSYWSEGNITSLPSLFAENYDGGILEFWADIFSVVEEHSRLLDICTGNGAIAILAREHFDRRGIVCDIHAIDVAEIQPPALQDGSSVINDIRYHAGVAVEATQFPDKYFDLVVGQFALEYCDLAAAIKELSRIIRDAGKIVLMMHHAESVTVRKSLDLIDIADAFLEEPTIFFRMRKFAEQYSRQKGTVVAKVAQKRKQLAASLDRANDLLKQYPTNLFLRATMDQIKHIIERMHGEAPIQVAEIREFESTVKSYLIRIRDQRDAALNAEDMSELDILFRQHGFQEVVYEPYYLNEVLFAWTLTARKSTAVHDAERQR